MIFGWGDRRFSFAKPRFTAGYLLSALPGWATRIALDICCPRQGAKMVAGGAASAEPPDPGVKVVRPGGTREQRNEQPFEGCWAFWFRLRRNTAAGPAGPTGGMTVISLDQWEAGGRYGQPRRRRTIDPEDGPG